jgi:hypothetical protein
MKPGDPMIRVGDANGQSVTIVRVGPKWVTTSDGERYHAKTLEHPDCWYALRTPEQHRTAQAEHAERSKLRDLLFRADLAASKIPIERVRRLIAALEE